MLIASDGSASHPHSPTHSPGQLAELRRREAVEAIELLAPAATVQQLDLPDGRLAEHVPGIVTGLRETLGADEDTWLLTTWLDDGHPDHAACALAAREVCAARTRTRLYEYPVWFWHIGETEQPPRAFTSAVRRFSLTSADQQARSSALGRYRSQVQPLSAAAGDEAVLPPGVLTHFDRLQDILLDVAPRPAAQADHFEELYATVADPWHLTDSWYERRKRAILLGCLPRERFRRCFEPGSARGDLSMLLAGRVDELCCAEGSAGAAAVASTRLAGRPGVRVDQLRIPEQWPSGSFDLVVLSEVGYYVERLDLLVTRIMESLDTDGVLALVHWRRAAPDHPHSAETVHDTIRVQSGLHPLVHLEEADFLLDILARDPRSVFQRQACD